MPVDHYRTVAARSEARQKIERSEFLGMAFPVRTEALFFAELEAMQKTYFDATHHSWAFRLFLAGETRARSSDAGEPGGSAGKPILNAIESSGFLDTGVVVVRWYGGVKLGTGGLARAYRDTATLALAAAVAEDRYLYDRIRVSVPFSQLSNVYRMIHPPDVILAGEHFGETNEFDFDVRRSLVETFTGGLEERRLAHHRAGESPTPR